MRLPIYTFAFGCAFYGGTQLPGKVFPKFTPHKYEGVSHSYYTSSQDVVGKFRLFETFEDKDAKRDLINFLSIYGTEALTKNDMMENIALQAIQEFDVGKMFRVKRMGKDKDDMFWTFGKIHGLENIAFADPAEVYATNGNPVKIQQLVNKYEGAPFTVDSYEHLVQELQTALREYRE